MQVKNLSRFTNLSLRRVFNVLIILLVVAVTAQVVKAASAFEQVADIIPGADGSSPGHLAVYNGELYFSAYDVTNGTELWKYDGTSVSMVENINTVGTNGSNPSYMTVYDGKLFFRADDGVNGVELWKYDGTAASLAVDINSGLNDSSPSYLAVYDGLLYFAANDGISGLELWKYDGTGASLAIDIVSGSTGSWPEYLAVYDNELYFRADGGDGKGTELWKYDGSSASLAADIASVSGDSSFPSSLAVYNGALYFSANDRTDVAGKELWKYDGSSASLAADIVVGSNDSSPEFLTVYNGALYFSAEDPTTGTEMWKYAGTSAMLVADTVTGSDGSYPGGMTEFNGALYFSAEDGITGAELWKYDGASPTVSAHSLQPNYTLTGPSTFTVTFSEDVNNPAGNTGSDDVTNPANFLLINKGANKVVDTLSCLGGVKVDDSKVSGSSVSYANPTATVTLAAPLPVGAYRLFVCGTTSIVDLAGNPLENGTDFSFDFSVDITDHIPPAVSTISLKSNYTGSGPTIFTVSFSEDVYNPEGDTDSDDVTNPANFLLIEKGVNQVVDTISCLVGVKTDDSKVSGARVSYANRIATVTLAEALPAGNYRLFICGTTSIVDLHGNTLNNGVDITFNFAVTKGSVKSLPKTGFAPNRVTVLPAQANGAAYTKLSGLWLDIPSQKLLVSIVGVPQLNDQWDVSWLGSSAGWLAGTAFPTWVGNSVITAHVTNANGLPGPFANLKNLVYGEQIVVHMYGAKYTYEVRDSRQVSSGATNYALAHLPDYSYLTLITCQNYDFLTDAYTYRRVVRAVLVSIAAE
jgi:LPXTG-site transpeptidase (sortase) family protein